MNAELPISDRFIDRLGRSTAIDEIADPVQSVASRLFGSDGILAPPIRDFLHGSWLGHALHPIVTDMPIGAWSVAALCDVFEFLGIARFPEAADVSLRIGTVSAFAAAITGWADWSDTKLAPKRLGMVHAAANGVALSGYLASWALRASDRRRAGNVVALASYALVAASAYVGGELSTGMLLGTKHTFTPASPPDDFVRTCRENELHEGGIKRVDVGGIAVLLSRSGSVVSAVANACTHRGGPLDEGTREGNCVRCPWHGARFALGDGAVVEGPATFPLSRFDARITDGFVEIRSKGE